MNNQIASNSQIKNQTMNQAHFLEDKLSFLWTTTRHAMEGCLAGFVTYWCVKIFQDKNVKHPIPYVLCGIFSSLTRDGIHFTFELVHKFALKISGERSKYEDGLNKHTVAGRLRTYSWKVVKHIEGATYRVDKVFSRAFKIRTIREIKEKNLSFKDLRTLEIIRKVFLEQIKDSFLDLTSNQLGFAITKALGYSLVGTEALIFMTALGFITGCFFKYQEIQQKIDEEKMKELLEERKQMARAGHHLLLDHVGEIESDYQPKNPENPLLYHSIEELTEEELTELKEKNLLDQYIKEAEPKEYPGDLSKLAIANTDTPFKRSFFNQWRWRWS